MKNKNDNVKWVKIEHTGIYGNPYQFSDNVKFPVDGVFPKEDSNSPQKPDKKLPLNTSKIWRTERPFNNNA